MFNQSWCINCKFRSSRTFIRIPTMTHASVRMVSVPMHFARTVHDITAPWSTSRPSLSRQLAVKSVRVFHQLSPTHPCARIARYLATKCISLDRNSWRENELGVAAVKTCPRTRTITNIAKERHFHNVDRSLFIRSFSLSFFFWPISWF